MGLFASSKGSVSRPGVFPIEVAAPTVIEGVSNGFVGLVMQSEWGEVKSAYKPTSSGDMLNTYFPAGCARTSTGYYATMRRKRVPWCLVRVLGASPVKASKTMTGTGGNAVATAKYHGTLGNSIAYEISSATDGDTDHRKVTFTLTDTNTGTTQEIYDNLAWGDTVDVSNSLLLSSFTISSSMTVWPVTTSGNLASGSNGSAITAADYEDALDELKLIDDVRVVVCDNTGDSIRDAVNAAMQAHVEDTTDRIAIIQDDPNLALATVETNVGDYRSDRVKYVGAWVKVNDDLGTAQISPFSTFMASAIANLQPQESEAWWADKVTDYYTAIRSVYAPFSTADTGTQDQCTTLGICLPIRLKNGRFAALHDRTTSLTVATRFGVTRRIKDYLAASIASGVTAWVNGPNVTEQQRSLVLAANDFAQREFAAGRFAEPPEVGVSGNNEASIAAGEFVVTLSGKSPGVMEKIFLFLNVGPTVSVETN